MTEPRGPRPSSPAWSLPRRATLAGGLALLALGLVADLLRLGRPGFGERQLLLVLAGALCAGAALPSRLWREPREGREPEGDEVGPAPVRPPGSGSWPGFRRAYRGLALLLLNSLVAVLLLNLFAALGLALTDRLGRTRPIDPELGSPLLQVPLFRAVHQAAGGAEDGGEAVLALADADLAAIYPGWPRSRVAALLAETRGRSPRFDPWTQFREKPFAGTFTHVEEAGFRRGADQGPWPMDGTAQNVWVFGGSTTFGYGLPDEATVPSQLQAALRSRFAGVPIRVYNFGQGFFYSGQEQALFTSLLTGGARPPRLAVFLDGINEHQAEPFFSDRLRRLVRSPWTAFLHPPEEKALGGEEAVERWLRSRRAIAGIAASHGIETLFVWQPAPDWGYDLRFHPLWWREGERPPKGERPVFGASPHYAAMARLRAAAPERLGADVLWLGDLQRGERRPLYVDRLHYTEAFAGKVAAAIADRLAQGPARAGGS
jgi:hypothetical protein